MLHDGLNESEYICCHLELYTYKTHFGSFWHGCHRGLADKSATFTCGLCTSGHGRCEDFAWTPDPCVWLGWHGWVGEAMLLRACGSNPVLRQV